MLRPLHPSGRSHCLAAFREIQSTLVHNKSHASTVENLPLFHGPFLTEIFLTEKKSKRKILMFQTLGPLHLSLLPSTGVFCLFWDSLASLGRELLGGFVLFETPVPRPVQPKTKSNRARSLTILDLLLQLQQHEI